MSGAPVRRHRPIRRGERGSYLPLFALLLVGLMAMMAIAVDLSALHTDRRAGGGLGQDRYRSLQRLRGGVGLRGAQPGRRG